MTVDGKMTVSPTGRWEFISETFRLTFDFIRTSLLGLATLIPGEESFLPLLLIYRYYEPLIMVGCKFGFTVPSSIDFS